MAHDPKNTELAPDFTVRDYERARDAQPPNREAIADALHRRFTARYLKPVTTPPVTGFTMMAVACLMIEALESFRQGWDTSDKRSQAAFCFFFDSVDEFKDVRGHGKDFYKHIRCGILHQAETTGGWRIRRDGSASFDPTARTVNAVRFVKTLRTFLDGFCARLKTDAWDSDNWKNIRRKFDAIVRHCEP